MEEEAHGGIMEKDKHGGIMEDVQGGIMGR